MLEEMLVFGGENRFDQQRRDVSVRDRRALDVAILRDQTAVSTEDLQRHGDLDVAQIFRPGQARCDVVISTDAGPADQQREHRRGGHNRQQNLEVAAHL
jgi:hypothetical protein